jgi:MFS family permease
MSDDRSRVFSLLLPQIIGGASIWLDAFLVFLVPVYTWNAPPGQVALIALCLGMAPLITGPLVGRWVDRHDIIPILWAGLALRALGTLGLALAGSIEVFLAWIMFKGVGNSLYFSSFAVVSNRLIAERTRLRYYSTFSIADQACKLGVPTLAGVSMLWWPAQQLFFVSATLLLATAPAVWAIHRWLRQTGQSKPACAEGANALTIKARAGLFSTCVLGVLLSSTLALYDPHLASHIRALDQPPLLFSALVSATACGALLGAVWARTSARGTHPAQLRFYGAIAFAVAVGLAALVVHYAQLGFGSAITLWLLNGFGYELMVIGSAVLLQNQAPPTRIATLTTTLRSLQLLAMMIAPSLGAVLIARIGPVAPLIAATVCAVPLVWIAAQCRRD